MELLVSSLGPVEAGRSGGADPLYADLADLMIGTGIRKGAALALHWDDVHLPNRTLFVRTTLSVIDNNQLLLTAPKTKGSRTWVALSHRVVDTLEDRAGSRAFGEITPAGGYVFHRHAPPTPRTSSTASTCPATRPASPASPCTTCATSRPASPWLRTSRCP
ncbi:hypothetical protein ACFWNL_14300 [Kitasatospora sp. NPDC058397]|uniref:hypothetical protein n=1 Tax=unclassified Kitasatospora TaxID=2633591 RepID=UPI003656B780